MKQCKPLAQAWLTHMNITTWYGISWVSMESWHKLVMLFWVSVDVYKQGCNQPLFEIMYKYYFNPQRVHACLASHGKHQRFEPVPKVCQCSVQKSAKAQWRKTKKEEKKKRKKKKERKKKHVWAVVMIHPKMSGTMSTKNCTEMWEICRKNRCWWDGVGWIGWFV